MKLYPKCLPTRVLYLLENAPSSMGCDEIAAVLNVRTKRVFRALSDLMAAGRVTRYGEPRMYRYGLPIRIAKRERLDNVQVVAM